MNADLPRQLAERLKLPLPGRAAHARFAPELSYGRQAGPAPESARRAAVMVVLYPHAGAWHLPLTVRPAHMAEHAGQISLPGGLIERGESSGDAAARELDEELGVGGPVDLLGKLSEFYVFVSNYCVTPWVGLLPERPRWQPSSLEVAEVLEVPLAHLMDPASCGRIDIERRGCTFGAPCFVWNEHKIWGATSMMLSELVEVVGTIGV